MNVEWPCSVGHHPCLQPSRCGCDCHKRPKSAGPVLLPHPPVVEQAGLAVTRTKVAA